MHNTDGLFLDFETASHCDLKLHGLARYLADESTKPYCFTFALPGMRNADLWELGQPVPREILDHIRAGKPFRAHNAGFDYHIWNGPLQRFVQGLPLLDPRQVQCSAARARYNGLPGSLERAALAMGLPIQKDMEGSAAMKELMTHPEWTPQTHPELFARTYKYALIDTDVMVALWDATQPMPEQEQRYWQLDLEINTRGFGCDVEAARGMEEMERLAHDLIDFELTVATDGKILTSTVTKQIQKFVSEAFGEEMDSGDREAVRNMLARDDIPQSVRDVLSLRLDASRSPKKHGAILRAHVDGRMCHSTVYHGALSGRSTAMGCGEVQSLNFARPRPGRKAEATLEYLEAVKRRDFEYLSRPDVGPPLAAMADSQRHLVCATLPDHVIVAADLSGIEARFAPWCADDEELLVEQEQGIDGYVVEASKIFKVMIEEVTSDQRQVGKVDRLALQFGGGDGALANMAAAYGIYLDDALRREIVWTYRENRPKMSTFWSVLEFAVLIALDQPGKPVEVPIGRGLCSKVTFVKDPVALRMHLPSGRAISYHNARLQLEPGASAPVAIYDKPEGYVETLDRKILSNNMVQGLARDLFWSAMLDVAPVEQIVHHVYDEMILEVPVERAELRLQQLIERLRKAPRWAPGLPLNAEGFVAPRWRK